VIETLIQSSAWKKANHLSLQLSKLTKGFPEDSRFDMGSVIREDTDQVLSQLEKAVTAGTFKDSVECMGNSFHATLRIRRLLSLSKYLGYMEEDPFKSLEKEINSLLLDISRRRRHFDYLGHSLHSDFAYSYALLRW